MVRGDFGEIMRFFIFAEFIVVHEYICEEGGFSAKETAVDAEFFAFGSDIEVYYGTV